jgi:hypothetical protein
VAGTGPAPAENRRRRNEPTRGDWVDLPPIDKPFLPELPEREDGEWRQQTIDSWAMWRMDPATALYTPAEVAYALDAIRLYDEKGPTPEIRLRMDGLGLTPKGKRDLRYRVSPDEQPVAPEVKRRTRTHGRRSRLSVVK